MDSTTILLRAADLCEKGWTLEFDAPAGTRMLHRFMGIEVEVDNADFDDTMWWDEDNRRWLTAAEFPWGKNNPGRTFHSSSMAACRSLKAFKRHLRRHADKLTGRRLRLVNRFVGHDVRAIPLRSAALRARAAAEPQEGE